MNPTNPRLAEPQSPLLLDVHTLTIGRGTIPVLAATANTQATTASWASGLPLVMRGVAKGRRRVELAFCAREPAPVYPLIGWTGDGVALLRNALLFK
jgi:hypothetical protein